MVPKPMPSEDPGKAVAKLLLRRHTFKTVSPRKAKKRRWYMPPSPLSYLRHAPLDDLVKLLVL